MARSDPALEGIRSVLLRLRTRAGLSIERLGSTEVDTAALAALPAVQQLAREGDSVDRAVVTVVTRLVEQLPPTDLLVADATLNLGVLRSRLGDRPEVEQLYSAELGDRRAALVSAWTPVHELLGVTPLPKVPTVRSLRGSVESAVLGRLAQLCVSESALEPAAAQAVNERNRATDGPVVVVGGAVMDHIYVVDNIPAPGTSVQATSFERHPGGKGLNLAVAGARLGLDTRLIAVIGDDEQAGQLLDYMSTEGLAIDLIKQASGAATPIITVAVDRSGEATAFGWRNETDLALTSADLKSRSLRQVVSGASAVLLTFEPPLSTIQWALRTATQRRRKPILLVQPSPPVAAPQQLFGHLSSVDYLVGTRWELAQLLGTPDQVENLDAVTQPLLALGVETVCVVEHLGCRIRSRQGDELDLPGPPVPLDDTPGARETFSAALTHQLLQHGPNLSRDALDWAVAAMAANLSLDDITDSMPVSSDVERVLEAETNPEQPT